MPRYRVYRARASHQHVSSQSQNFTKSIYKKYRIDSNFPGKFIAITLFLMFQRYKGKGAVDMHLVISWGNRPPTLGLDSGYGNRGM